MQGSKIGWWVVGIMALGLVLGGCKEWVTVLGDDDSAGGQPGDDDTSGGDDDTAVDTYGIELSYTFDGYVDPATTCEEAWISTLYVNLALDGVDQPQQSFSCDDTPILIGGLDEGEWTVMVASVEDVEAETGPYSASGDVTVHLGAGPNPLPVDIEIECNENGVDDGCGGA
jgi:hypothetical protein